MTITRNSVSLNNAFLVAALVLFIIAALMAFAIITAGATVTAPALAYTGLACWVASSLV